MPINSAQIETPRERELRSSTLSQIARQQTLLGHWNFSSVWHVRSSVSLSLYFVSRCARSRACAVHKKLGEAAPSAADAPVALILHIHTLKTFI
jgi:hypothetical protein